MTKQRCRTIALCATKGGVGKTTIAAALAVRAAQSGSRVALLDSDPQESLGSWWDRRGTPDNPKLFEVDSTAEAIRLIEAEGFAWVIVDTPPATHDLIEQAIVTADHVLIPCRASVLDITAVEMVIELCREHGKPFAFVLNAVDPRAKITASAATVLAQSGPVLATRIANRNAYAAAMTNGKSGPEIERDGAAAREIDALWAEVSKLAAGKVRR